MSTNFCPSCNAAVPPNAAFCTTCGQRMEQAPAPDGPPLDAGADDETRVVDRSDMAPPPADSWADPQSPTAWEPQPNPTQAVPDQPWATADQGSGPEQTPQYPPAGGQQWTAAPSDGPAEWQPSPDAGQQQWGQDQGQPHAWPPPAPEPAAATDWSAQQQAPQQQWDQSAGADAPAKAQSKGAAGVVGAIGIVAAIATGISVFLTWYVGKSDGGTGHSITGWDLFGKADIVESAGNTLALESQNPLILLVLAVLLVALAVLAFSGRAKIAAVGIILIGLGIVGVGVRDWMSVSDIASKELRSSDSIEAGMGIYLAWVGGGLAAIAGVLGLIGSKKA